MAVVQADCRMVYYALLMQFSAASISVSESGRCSQNSSSLLQKIVQDAHGGISNQRAASCAVDIVLVLDISISVGFNYPALRAAATQFIEKLEAKDKQLGGGSRVGLISFSTVAQWHSKLTPEFEDVDEAVENMPPIPLGLTNLADALNKADQELTSSMKTKSQKVALVITDGEPWDAVCGNSNLRNCPSAEALATGAANKLKEHARLAIVGIQDAHTKYMKSLVSPPVQGNFFPLTQFSGLTDSFIGTLLEKVCAPSAPMPAPETGAPAPIPGVAPTPEQPPLVPSPAPACKKDTEAPCEVNGVCFQRTRGDTECNAKTHTCWCTQPDECVGEVEMPLSKKWKVCRKVTGDVKYEKNILKWSFSLTQDILSSYSSSLR
jgi:Mg-chelatase subunit ChlD